MRAIAIAAFGGPEQLQVTERPEPVAGAGEVLLAVRASGVNRPDVLQRSGHYPPPPGASDLPGLEVAGVILGGDEEAMRAAGLVLGQRVCALLAGGGYAERCVAPVAQCLPIPEGLSDVEAASLPETFFTVWSNLFDRAALKCGETLLVQGGSSGIGVAAIQMAKAMGARVLVTAGSDDKCQACLALGADLAINYQTQDFVQAALDATQGRGVDVILDMVAGPYIEREVAALAEDGRLVVIAVQGGAEAQFNAAQLMRKRLTLTGSTLRARSVAFKGAIAQALRQQVWPELAAGRIRAVIDQCFDALAPQDGWPTGAAAAHARMQSRQHIGKLILTWPEA